MLLLPKCNLTRKIMHTYHTEYDTYTAHPSHQARDRKKKISSHFVCPHKPVFFFYRSSSPPFTTIQQQQQQHETQPTLAHTSFSSHAATHSRDTYRFSSCCHLLFSRRPASDLPRGARICLVSPSHRGELKGPGKRALRYSSSTS